MNLQKVAERLGITEERLHCLQETIISESNWPEPGFLRFEKETSGIEAGTAIFRNGEVVFGYPKVKTSAAHPAASRRGMRGAAAG